MFKLKDKNSCRWDLVSLGEVMLRFDSGDERIHTARTFRVWEGGGEYNVARGLRKVFGQRTALVTSLAKNQVGELVEDLMLQGGVDISQILWRETDGISRQTRNGMYFYERGFGFRQPTGCSDRGNTAVSQLQEGEINWDEIFGKKNGARWFHTGGIFVGLSETTPAVALEAMKSARKNGVIVSYDLNYRGSLWSERGGLEAANEVNQQLLPYADVVFGLENFHASFAEYNENIFRRSASDLSAKFPTLQVIATTLRDVKSANYHDLSGVCFASGNVFKANNYLNTAIIDRIGSGDAFGSGTIYGFLAERGEQFAIDCGTAHAVLAMTTPGDNSMTTLAEIEKCIQQDHASIKR